MKKLYISLLTLFCCLGTTEMLAQNAHHNWGLGIGYAFRDFQGVNEGQLQETDFKGAISLSLGRYLSPSFDIGLNLGLTPLNFGNPRDLRELTDLDAAIRYKFNNGYMLDEMAAVAPYLTAGIGANIWKFDDADLNFSIPVGAGIKFQLSDPLAFDLNAIYKPSISDFEDYLSLNAALVFNFGEGSKPKDRDQDGVIDEIDLCPDEAGLAKNNGCPDTDGDGVIDKFDQCPIEAGVAALEGCPNPDKDGDGINDDDDQCPDEAGPIEANGCPDRDEDGTPDKDDNCPNVFGLANLNGCPDTDGDGIADNSDACPNEAGSTALNGCPDKDGDGIMDSEDKCPDQAGTINLSGCPEIEEEEQEKLDLAVRSVQFETASANLRNSSFAVLDEIGEILKKYPGYSLRVSGHTDSVGDAARNQRLSENRAKACVDYLVSVGIEKDRLKFIGYGETNPIADNINRAGRAKNRRVEFELYIE